MSVRQGLFKSLCPFSSVAKYNTRKFEYFPSYSFMPYKMGNNLSQKSIRKLWSAFKIKIKGMQLSRTSNSNAKNAKQ